MIAVIESDLSIGFLARISKPHASTVNLVASASLLCLSKTCTINYKCSNYRNRKSEVTLSWIDPDVKIKWPVKKPILSKKDKKGLSLKSIKKLI